MLSLKCIQSVVARMLFPAFLAIGALGASRVYAEVKVIEGEYCRHTTIQNTLVKFECNPVPASLTVDQGMPVEFRFAVGDNGNYQKYSLKPVWPWTSYQNLIEREIFFAKLCAETDTCPSEIVLSKDIERPEDWCQSEIQYFSAVSFWRLAGETTPISRDGDIALCQKGDQFRLLFDNSFYPSYQADIDETGIIGSSIDFISYFSSN